MTIQMTIFLNYSCFVLHLFYTDDHSDEHFLKWFVLFFTYYKLPTFLGIFCNKPLCIWSVHSLTTFNLTHQIEQYMYLKNILTLNMLLVVNFANRK